MALDIHELLHEMVRRNASDLHVKAGSPPGLRIDGEMQRIEEHSDLTPEQTTALVRSLMTEDQRARFEKQGDLDFSYAVRDLARFRVNALTQRGSHAIVIRQIPDSIPTAAQLNLPQICIDLAMKPRGLVLVTGPTGSGKSTTLAALIDYVNATEYGHILTMEDPLEFVHKDQRCYVTQRQIGQDCTSFSEALRRAMRQDPDVILIGEMRDLETISMAITAAETGHLVFATLHTTSAISTVDRIIDVFPPDAQQQIRIQLASTLQGVISQTLVPKIGGGRCAAREILIATDGVRSLIREGKTAQLLNQLQTGKSHGMATLEMELANLVSAGLVRFEDALSRANRPDEIARSTNVRTQGPANNDVPARGSAAGKPAMGSQRTAPVTKPKDPGGMFKR